MLYRLTTCILLFAVSMTVGCGSSQHSELYVPDTLDEPMTSALEGKDDLTSGPKMSLDDVK